MSNSTWLKIVSPFRYYEEDEDDLRLRQYYQHQLRSLLDVDSSGGAPAAADASPHHANHEVEFEIEFTFPGKWSNSALFQMSGEISSSSEVALLGSYYEGEWRYALQQLQGEFAPGFQTKGLLVSREFGILKVTLAGNGNPLGVEKSSLSG